MTPAHAPPLSIIVAGEDAGLRQHVAAMLLGRLGARVHQSGDGWDTMSLLLTAAHPIDLVVSDLHVVRRRALDLLLSVRAAGITVPFILLDTVDRSSPQDAAARLGALILGKPVVASELHEGVHRLCTPRRTCHPGSTCA